MSKPREFWIAAKNNGNFDAFEMPCDDYSGFHRAARVIEKSAYENLEAKLAIATEALERYAKSNASPKGIHSADLARETLAEIRSAMEGK